MTTLVPSKGHISAIKRELNMLLARETKTFIERHPHAKNLSASVETHVYPKRPPNFGKQYARVMELLLLGPQFRAMSNSELAAYVSKSFAGYTVSQSFLVKPLDKFAKVKVQAVLDQHASSLDLSKHNTLSKLKLALRGVTIGKAAPASDTFTATFTFTDGKVTVGNRVFPTSLTGTGKHRFRVGTSWIPCEALETLLRSSR